MATPIYAHFGAAFGRRDTRPCPATRLTDMSRCLEGGVLVVTAMGRLDSVLSSSHSDRGRRALNGVLIGSGATLGVLLVAWGLWILYVGIVDLDPESEIPRWVSFALCVPVLALG